jgi:hypothetical protein
LGPFYWGPTGRMAGVVPPVTGLSRPR